MKKTLALALALIMVVATFASCSSSSYVPLPDNLDKYITLGQYKEIEVSQEEMDSDYEEKVQALIDDATEQVDIDRAIIAGDSVTATLTCQITNDDGEYEDYTGTELKKGDITFDAGDEEYFGVDGMDEIFIGKEVSEDAFDFNYTFGDDASDALAGRTAKWTITITAAQEDVVPEWTDEFVAENTDYETIEEYKTETYESLKESAVWDAIVEGATVLEYPEKNVKSYYDSSVSYYESYASYLGVTLDYFCTYYYGTTTETLLASIISSAKSQVKQQLVYAAIAEAEGITVTDEEYENRIDELVESYGSDDRETFEKNYDKEAINFAILSDIVIDFVVDSAIVK